MRKILLIPAILAVATLSGPASAGVFLNGGNGGNGGNGNGVVCCPSKIIGDINQTNTNWTKQIGVNTAVNVGGGSATANQTLFNDTNQQNVGNVGFGGAFGLILD